MNGPSPPYAGDQVLDIKPLRTLSPLLPPSLHPFSFQTPPFLFFPSPSPNPPPERSHLSTPPPSSKRKRPRKHEKPEKPEKESEKTPPFSFFPSPQPTEKTHFSTLSSRRKRPPKTPPPADVVAPAPPDDPIEAVEGVLQTFDAIRRRLLQLDVVTGGMSRAEMKAGAAMSRFNLRTNAAKRAGPVPGVSIGDVFFLRIEMLLVGLHQQSMAGIDFITEGPVALSVVASCGHTAAAYDDDTGSMDELVYSGQGSGADQKLERGNLALERCCRDGGEVRVVRGVNIPGTVTRLYIYDGLYRVSEFWTETAPKTGFSMFKFRLLRQPGQPAAFAVWKATDVWRRDGALSRGPAVRSLDLAGGAEAFPVVLVNEVDAGPDPAPFVYVSGRPVSNVPLPSMSGGCRCERHCVGLSEYCECGRKNGGVPPYIGGCRLVRRRPVVYECGPACPCLEGCQLRATQSAPKLHFEVFKTVDRGWGLRSWDAIRRGDFVCEFIGDELDIGGGDGDDNGEDGFVFEGTSWGKGADEWNYGPELVGDPPPEEKVEAMAVAVTAKKRGNVARFINHSCWPNLFWQAVVRAGEEGRRQCHIMFFARRHIAPMAELTYDYGGAGARGKESKCQCGEPNCRGSFYRR